MDLRLLCGICTLILILLACQVDANSAPSFGLTPPYVQKFEDTPKGTSVYTLTATDSDNDVLTYSMDSSADGKLLINSSTGEITTDKVFDAEQEKEFTVTVSATDPSGSKASTSFKYYVLDLNDNSPQFQNIPYEANILENTNKQQSIFKVEATDLDVDSKYGQQSIIYSISDGNEDGYFKINEDSGEITLIKILDYEATKLFNLTIIVMDYGGQPWPKGLNSSTSLIINVLDFDDMGPVFNDSSYSAVVKENAAKDTLVTQVFAEDGDKGLNDTVTYTKLEDSDPDNIFYVDENTGMIYLNGTLDTAVQNTYTITISAQSTDQTAVTCTVVITVQDINNHKPTFSQNFTASVSENSESGTFVVTVLAEDKDEGDNSVFEYSLSGADASKFEIDANGLIQTTEPLDRETQDTYSFVVTAKETNTSDQFEGEATVEVTVTDVNDNNPEFTESEYSFVVSEGESGANVGIVTATDKDEGDAGIVHYKFPSSSDKFSIDSVTGVITTKQALSSQTDPQHTLTVIAEDQEHPNAPRTATVTVKITVTEAPTFRMNASITENQPAQELVNVTESLKLLVDANLSAALFVASIQCKIIDGNTVGQFNISATCVLSTIQELDREQIAEHLIKIGYFGSNATAGPLAIVEVNVLVDDENDNIPKFNMQPFLVNVKEDLTVGESITQVQAVDSDDGENNKIYYKFYSGNDDGFFAIDKLTGIITLAKSLDHENKGEFVLKIKASNVDSRRRKRAADSDIITVRIEIVDANDSPPVFTKSVFVGILTTENTQKTGHIVTTVLATDLDQGNFSGLIYSVVSGNGSGFFKLDQLTGEVSVQNTVTAQAGDMLEMIVNAKDNYGNSPFNEASEKSSVQIYILTLEMLTSLTLGVSKEIVEDNMAEIQAMLEEITGNSSVVIDSISSKQNGETVIKFYTVKDGEVVSPSEVHNEINRNSELVAADYSKWNVHILDMTDPAPRTATEQVLGTMEAVLLTLGVCIGLFGLIAILAVCWYRKKEIERLVRKRKPSKVTFNDNPYFIEPDTAVVDHFAPGPGQETQEVAIELSSEDDDKASCGSNDSIIMIKNPAFDPEDDQDNMSKAAESFNRSTPNGTTLNMNGNVPNAYYPPPPSAAPPPPPLKSHPPLRSTYQIPRAQFLNLTNLPEVQENDYEEVNHTPMSTFKPPPDILPVIDESEEESNNESEDEEVGHESASSIDSQTHLLNNGFVHHTNIPPPPPPPPSGEDAGKSIAHDQKNLILNDLREKFENQPELVTHL